uniref:Uncharacterized protein n=1 Tax=Amphiprion ocellaris TaxID=80972 RepID=A0A3Q1C2D6_AMPOC
MVLLGPWGRGCLERDWRPKAPETVELLDVLQLMTNCYLVMTWSVPQVSNGTWFHQLKLRYFDHLLRENMTAVVACEDPATWTLPAVSYKRHNSSFKHT